VISDVCYGLGSDTQGLLSLICRWNFMVEKKEGNLFGPMNVIPNTTPDFKIKLKLICLAPA
jgi:hypothetical protein